MKKVLIFLMAALMAFGMLSACGNDAKDNADSDFSTDYEDGIYFAQSDFAENGWKYTATIEVKDGEIVSAEWNGANRNGGKPKIQSSADGDYGMVAKGGAASEWHEQAKLAEDYLIDKQDPTAIEYTSEEGHTDAIAGVSIHVKEFFDLAEEALSKDPVGVGPYKNGTFHAEEPEFTKGWKYTADLTVINGFVVAANWNGISEEEGADDKKTQSADGRYGMVANGGASSEWHEQAELAEAHLIEIQDPTAIEYTSEDGHTDAIAGVSIHIKEFYSLAEQALEKR